MTLFEVLNRNRRVVVVSFFIVLLVTGIATYKDYGIAGDEIISRNNGLVSYKYAVEGDRGLFSYRDRYYGPAFEQFLVWIERLAGFDDTKDVFRMRHLAGFLLFYLGIIFFYLLLSYSFRDWKYGLLGSLFLVLTPRIFAHAFFNSKDAGFMSVFIIGIYTLIRYLDDKTLPRALFHAAVCAVLVDIRIMGLILPLLTGAIILLDIFASREKRKSGVIISFLVYLWAFAMFTVLFWPFLWENSLKNFIEAFNHMKSFPWDGYVLYYGSYIRSLSLPWHYIPAWILITTPPGYMFFFAAGVLGIIISFVKAPLKAYAERKHELVFLGLFFLPLAAVILLKAVLYDGWRHMFFIYPAFLLVSVSGVRAVKRLIKDPVKGRVRLVGAYFFTAVIVLSLSGPFIFMVRWHPYQNVYFNFLSGGMDTVRQKFEMDYWGTSYKEALEYIMASDRGDKIKVYITSLGGVRGWIPALILDAKDRKRLSFVDSSDNADYVLSNYRWHPADYPFPNEVYSVNVNGAKIAVVYKLK